MEDLKFFDMVEATAPVHSGFIWTPLNEIYETVQTLCRHHAVYMYLVFAVMHSAEGRSHPLVKNDWIFSWYMRLRPKQYGNTASGEANHIPVHDIVPDWYWTETVGNINLKFQCLALFCGFSNRLLLS